MPAKNSVKVYVEGGYYHLYNRGVEKRNIFLENKDYVVFLRFLKEYLLPLEHPNLKILQGINPRRKPINCFDDIQLLAYCLMPNHFHLFVKQKSRYGLTKFMKALLTNYSMYLNNKLDRIGPLFQGVYKAALIETEPYYLHVTRYIHRNPLKLARVDPLQSYPYSSYSNYLEGRSPDWLHISEVLSFFKSHSTLMPNSQLSYQTFVEGFEIDDKEVLGDLALEKV